MTRVTLVNPQMPFKADVKNDSYIKMGLAYLSACLKKEGHTVSLVDFRLCSDWLDVIEQIFFGDPGIVCITAFSSEKDDAIKLGQWIKKLKPSLPVMIGGIHASICPEDYVAAGCFDYIIRGEGEVTVPKIVKAPAASVMSTRVDAGRLSDMAHVVSPIVVWGETPDLNSLPFPDRELWQDYEKRTGYPPVYVRGMPWVEVISTRGCWANCAFCSAHGEKDHFTRELNGKRVPYIRGRSVENVISELKELDAKYHIEGIQFLDDQWIMNPKWMWDFCDAIEKSGLTGKHWWIGTRVDVLLKNKDLMIRMKSVTGSLMVSVGWESFSQDLLDFWGKGTTVEQNYLAAKFLKDNGMKVFGNVIMGAPRSDGKWHIEDDLENISAMRAIQPDHMSWSIFTAVQGSELYQWCIDNGLSTARNTGFRSAGESKIKGVNWRWIRIQMNELVNGRPWWHNAYDRVMMKLEGW